MYSRVQQKPKKRSKFAGGALIASFLLVCYATAMLVWPIGSISATIVEQPTIPASSSAISWPDYGQSALYADGYGLLGSSGTQASTPIASITKVVTALTVLKSKPITDPANSPPITPNTTHAMSMTIATVLDIVKADTTQLPKASPSQSPIKLPACRTKPISTPRMIEKTMSSSMMTSTKFIPT